MAAGTGEKARFRERGDSRRDLARRVAPETPPSPLAWRQSRMKTDVIDADSAPSQQPTWTLARALGVQSRGSRVRFPRAGEKRGRGVH